MRRFRVDLVTAGDTMRFGRWVGGQLAPGDMVTLSGQLGAGKTTFTQGLAEGLGVTESVTSPTFVVVVEHHARVPLLHMDAYRLEGLGAEELNDAGFFDFLQREDAVKVVEWPEMVREWLPNPPVQISFELGERGERIAFLTLNEEMELQDDGNCPYPLKAGKPILRSENDR